MLGILSSPIVVVVIVLNKDYFMLHIGFFLTQTHTPPVPSKVAHAVY